MTLLERPVPTGLRLGTDPSPPSLAALVVRRRPHLLLRLSVWSVVAVVVAWGGFLPVQIGGRMSYVITDGTSMLPHFHAGDLVVTRREASYHVGEVAAFHNVQLHAIVLHRIVAIHGGRFVFKGDNNTWPTLYEPTKSEIVGAAWIHVPRGGRLLIDLRNPGVAAGFLVVLWLFSFSPTARSRRQRRRHRRAH